MGRIAFAVVGAVAAMLASAGAPASAQDLSPMPRQSLAPMLEEVVESVVSISVKGSTTEQADPLLSDPFFRRFFGLPEAAPPTERPFQAAGSGVVVDAAKGYILTNNHVVENADEITVSFSDRRTAKGSIVGRDPETDLAVIRVEVGGLQAIPLGDSSNVKVGDFVVAVGNPFGLGQTVTFGIVSAVGRSGLGIEGYEDFIQTDAAINPGNSGGALVDMSGRLVGINSAIIGPSGGNVGIGFAIPSDMAKRIMAQLIAHGSVQRGRLGVTIQDLTPELAAALHVDAKAGAVVSQVLHSSAAENAGVESGDVILSVDGKPVGDADGLRNLIGAHKAGDTVALTLARGASTKTVSARLIEVVETEQSATKGTGVLAGVILGSAQPVAVDGETLQAVPIVSVDADSHAAEVGLEAGDAIVAVDRQPVTSADDVLNRVDGKTTVLLSVYHEGGVNFVPL